MTTTICSTCERPPGCFRGRTETGEVRRGEAIDEGWWIWLRWNISGCTNWESAGMEKKKKGSQSGKNTIKSTPRTHERRHEPRDMDTALLVLNRGISMQPASSSISLATFMIMVISGTIIYTTTKMNPTQIFTQARRPAAGPPPSSDLRAPSFGCPLGPGAPRCRGGGAARRRRSPSRAPSRR